MLLVRIGVGLMLSFTMVVTLVISLELTRELLKWPKSWHWTAIQYLSAFGLGFLIPNILDYVGL